MENNSCFFHFSDIKSLLYKKKYLYLIVFLICFIIAGFIFLVIEPKHESNATFFENSEKKQTIGNLKDMVLSDNPNISTDATSLIKTKSFMKEIVEKLALQISCIKNQTFFEKFYTRICKNLKIEFDKHIELLEEIQFSEAYYQGIKTEYFFLKILSEDNFIVLDENKNFLIKANVLKPVKLANLSFQVDNIPKSCLGNLIKIKITPALNKASEIIKELKIEKENPNSNFLILKIKDTNPYRSRDILNNIMQHYQEHLRKESKDIAKRQLQYLEKRKQSYQEELYFLFDEYDNYLHSNIKKEGFISLDSEVNLLLKQKEVYKENLTKTIKELEYIHKFNLQDIDENVFLEQNQLELIDKIKRLKNEKEVLLSSFQKDPFMKGISLDVNSKKTKEIEKMVTPKEDMDSLIAKVDKENNKNHLEKSSIENNYINSPKDFSEDEILKQNISDNTDLVDLKTAGDLYLEFDKKRETLQSEMYEVEHILQKINTKDFKISNISSYLNSEIIKNVFEISKKLENSENYTDKETESLKQEYSLEKKYIIYHLKETLNLKRAELRLIDQKLFSLKKVKINLITKEIAFISTKLKNLIIKETEKLTDEKKLLKEKLEDINLKMQNLVSKIGFERK